MRKIILCSLLSFVFAGFANAAGLVARPTSTINKGSAAGRSRPVATSVVAQTAVVPEPIVKESAPEQIKEVVEEAPIIDSEKAGKFSAALNGQSASSSGDSELKNLIKSQRSADESSSDVARTKVVTTGGRNFCDENLRICMKEKCGENFKNCALDTDLLWGEKIESCRAIAKCSGAEYAAFAPEIKADRDSYQLLGNFVEVQTCGSEYNECLVTGCGTQLNGCLNKAAGDKVISDCSKISEKCRTADSGLAARAMDVLGTMRQDVEKQVPIDEKELYTLRDKMESQCKSLGAMFDTRTMSCVFSVEFWVAGNSNPFASRKLYVGKTFDCTQEWFGVDVTTYKEDAARLTREQKGATSALMGAGIGTLGGTITNGIMNGGFGKTDQQDNADKANDAYQQECEAQGGKIKSGKCDISSIQKNAKKADEKLKKQTEEAEAKAKKEAEAKAKAKK